MPTIPNQDNQRDYFVVTLQRFQTALQITDATSWRWEGLGLKGWFKARRPDTVIEDPRTGVAYKVIENYTLVNMENIKEGFFGDLPDELFVGMSASFEDYAGVPSVLFNLGPERPVEV